jgi:hypothetical protein
MERSDGAAARREFLTKKRRRTATNDAYLRIVEMRAAAEMEVDEETKAAKRLPGLSNFVVPSADRTARIAAFKVRWSATQ